MPESNTLYDLIGVPPGCDGRALDRAYRRLARTLHPDTNPDPAAQRHLALVNDAYSTLSHPDRRAAYDATIGAPGPTPAASTPVAAATSAPATAHGLDPLTAAGLDPATRVQVAPAAPGRGADVHAVVALTPAETRTGARRLIAARCDLPCRVCDGTGGDPAAPRGVCPTCDGIGMDATTGAPCPPCSGRGSLAQRGCGDCAGAGTRSEEYATEIVLGPGERDQTQRRYPRRGLPGRSGQPAGDLLVTITVALPDCFVRSAGGVGIAVPFRYSELRLGLTVTIPTPAGSAPLTVPAGTSPGDVLVLPGAGLPQADGSTGPLHVRVDLAVAGPATGQDRDLLAALLAAENRDGDPRAHLPRP